MSDGSATSTTTPEISNLYHVVFLHRKLRNRHEDRYMLDMAEALRGFGHRITLVVSEFDETEPLTPVDPKNPDRLEVVRVGRIIPNSVFGTMSWLMAILQMLWIALYLTFFPPLPKPRVVVLDAATFVMALFSRLTTYKTIYINHFPGLYASDPFTPSMRVTSDILTIKTLRYANEILVESRGLLDVFRRSFPKLERTPTVLYPCYSSGAWRADTVDPRTIIPDLPDNFRLFVVLGRFKRRSNFELVLRALEHLYYMDGVEERDKFHVAMGGHFDTRSALQRAYYAELVRSIKHRPYANQVTFLKGLSTVQKKTLLASSVALVHTARFDVYPRTILAAMSLGKIVISVNYKLSQELFENRISGLFVEPDPHKIARVLAKVGEGGNLPRFLGSMCRSTYESKYGWQCFADRIHGLILKHGKPKIKICL